MKIKPFSNLSPEPPFGCFLSPYASLLAPSGSMLPPFCSPLAPSGSLCLSSAPLGSPFASIFVPFCPPPFGGIFPPFWLPLAPKLLFLQFLLRFSMFLREFSKKCTKTLPLDSPWCCDSDFGRIKKMHNLLLFLCVFFQNDIKTDQKTKK